MTEQFDIVIIGSGAGGAPIAHEMARAGKHVLVLEKGPLIAPQYQRKDQGGFSAFKRDELISDGPEKRLNLPGIDNNGTPYYASHIEPDINDEPHIYADGDKSKATLEGYTAQAVGGGTNLYGAVSL